MPFSQAAICNLAMGHLGISATIDDLDADETTAGEVCRTHYDLALEQTLRALRWPFAEREATLATISGFDSEVWTYAYRAPADYLRAWSINATDIDEVGDGFKVGGDDSGAVIYSDAEDAVLAYTAKVSNTGLYPALFVEALAWSLAWRIAQPMSAEESLRQAARTGYRQALTDAAKEYGNEVQARPGGDDGAFLDARELTTDA